MQVIDELMVCVDCLFFIANGDLPEGPKAARRVEQSVTRDMCCGDSDKDEEFSWSECDCCGSGLAGSRHHVVRLG